jgi:hypothetical protein
LQDALSKNKNKNSVGKKLKKFIKFIKKIKFLTFKKRQKSFKKYLKNGDVTVDSIEDSFKSIFGNSLKCKLGLQSNRTGLTFFLKKSIATRKVFLFLRKIKVELFLKKKLREKVLIGLACLKSLKNK